MAATFKIIRGPVEAGHPLPEQFTCEGANQSPPLTWNDPPEGTESFALIMDDPDAPARTFVHWILFNLPPDRRALPPGLDVEAHFEDAALQPVEGANDFGDLGYGGPCPPPGDDPHRYAIRLYALNTTLDLGPGVTRKQLTETMSPYVLAEADFMVTFQRSG